MNCIIIDDEKLARSLVREYLEPFHDITIIDEAKNGSQALALIDSHKPDLVFLDIQMPDMNGFQVLQQCTYQPSVIFTTAYDQYAIEAFDLHATDYLLKPLSQERFNKAVSRVLQQQQQPPAIQALLDHMQTNATVNRPKYDSHFIAQKANKMINLAVKDIMYIQAAGDFSILHSNRGEFISNRTMHELASRLDPAFFPRIHRSSIINIEYLSEVIRVPNQGLKVKMQNEKVLSVSRTYHDNIKDRLI